MQTSCTYEDSQVKSTWPSADNFACSNRDNTMSRLILTAQTLQRLLAESPGELGAAKRAYVKPTVNIIVRINFCSLLVRNFHTNGIGFDFSSVQKTKPV